MNKRKNSNPYEVAVLSKDLASTYSPEFELSTIGGAGLNCSVRDGKR
jgi:hypothetical protein